MLPLDSLTYMAVRIAVTIILGAILLQIYTNAKSIDESSKVKKAKDIQDYKNLENITEYIYSIN